MDGNGGGVVGLTAARGPEPVGADDGATGIFGSAAFAAGVPVGASGSPLLFSAADGFGGGAADRLGGFGGTIGGASGRSGGSRSGRSGSSERTCRTESRAGSTVCSGAGFASVAGTAFETTTGGAGFPVEAAGT